MNQSLRPKDGRIAAQLLTAHRTDSISRMTIQA